MPAFICQTCGTQFPESVEPSPRCRICEEERQFVPASGQQWTTPEQLRAGHRNAFQHHEPDLLGIGTMPEFAIGQRALLLQREQGNFLWDCISLLDDATIEIVKSLGGLRGIAISHPHFYSSMVEWSHAFGDVPVYLNVANRKWVMRPDPVIEFWDGPRKEIAPGLTLLNCGGHFTGGTVMHWANGAEGRGVLLTGDILSVRPDGNVSFMYSYPNLIPLSAKAVHGIAEALESFAYDRIYGGWWGSVIETGAKAIVADSVKRYLQALEAC
jgi:glyoxylase-like metal-dependent hydrolase (beta-lactamase superfamily II)